MTEKTARLRAQADKARALLRAVADPVTVERLTAYATECDETAERLEPDLTKPVRPPV